MQKINSFIFSAFIYCISATLVFAQSAALLPMAQQQFFDNNGNPLATGTVSFYYPSTLNLKPIWQDANESVVYTNPVTLNSAGRPPGSQGIYGQGAYRQIVKDVNGNTIWDALTSSAGSSSGTAATGDGDLVGTIKPWAGITAPNQYQFAYGQQLNRTTFAALFTAITLSINVTCTSTSNTLSGISDTSSIPIGAPVEVSACVAPGTTVSSKTASSVVMSNPSSVSLNTTAVFFPFGNGDGSTTFTLPDFRGNVIAGRPNMGGTASTNLTNCTNAAQGTICGNQNANHVLLQAELPAFKPAITITDPGHIHSGTFTVNSSTALTTQGNLAATASTTGVTTGGSAATFQTSSAQTGVTAALTNNLGSGTALSFSIVQPTITLNYIIKVTPDTNSAIATGVTDIGGMIGSIACGTGVLCTGNTISINNIACTAILCPAGIDANILNAQASNYTIAITDCGKTIQAGTGSTGFFTITLPSITSFPTTCKVTTTNGDTGRAKGLSGFPSNVFAFLWPKQTVVAEIVNGAWIVNAAPGRWRLTGGVTLFVDNSVGSDSNDCLAAGASNACLTFSSAFSRMLNQWDANNQTVTLQAAAAQTFSNVSLPNQVSRGAIVIDGGGGTFTTSTATPAIQINGNRALGTVFLQNVTITCSGGGPGVNVTGGITVTQAGITYGSCVGGQHRLVANGGEMTASGSYSITGGAAAHVYSDSQSLEDDFQAITVTCTGAPSFTQAFATAVLNGTVYSAATTYSGCGAVTGNRYTAQTNGFVSSVGGGAHYFPGNSEGFSTTGGHYDTPGTPVISSCGTSPSVATGTDTNGHVTEGTTATTCTITFTTANQPNACTINISNATAAAALVVTTLNATTLVVGHPSVSNAILYWNCPTN